MAAGKSERAYRTIGEAAEALDVPAHVLRFWETKFHQIKPLKRAGGRRFYRPQDIALIARIKSLLHDEGLTIKGVQKLLREQGLSAVLEGASGAADNPAARLKGALTRLTEAKSRLDAALRTGGA